MASIKGVTTTDCHLGLLALRRGGNVVRVNFEPDDRSSGSRLPSGAAVREPEVLGIFPSSFTNFPFLRKSEVESGSTRTVPDNN
jgi:hypothetical protein